jgi:hypothetical protein
MKPNDYHRRVLLQYGVFTALLVAFAVFYFRLAVHASTPLLDGDDAIYALMADYFSPFSASPPAITELVMRYTRFPPFYPFLLGIVGADSSHLAAMHAISVGFFLAASIVLFGWSQAVLRDKIMAGLIAVIVAALPVTIAQAFGILSENLYLLLSLAALLCLTRQTSGRWVIAGTVLIAFACLTRTIGFALLIAFLGCLTRTSFTKRVQLAAIAVIPTIIWGAWKLLRGYHGDYSDSLLDALQGSAWWDLQQWQARAPWRGFWGGWIASFDNHPSMTTLVAGSTLGILCLAGAVKRALLRQMDGAYVLLYLLIILLWPYAYEARRFLYPIMPILLVQGLLLVRELSRWRPHRLAVAYPYVCLAAAALIALPSIFLTVERFVLAQTPEERDYAVLPSWYAYENLADARTRAAEQLTLVQAWKHIKDKVEEGQCIYHVKPVSLMLYADRVSYATPLVAPGQRAELLSAATQCRYFYLAAYVYYPYRDAFYPQKYLQDLSRLVDVHYVDVPGGGRRVVGVLVETKRS